MKTPYERPQSSFNSVDSHDVGITFERITREGDSATVNATRKDVIVNRWARPNGNTRRQSFVLTKSGGSWVIVQMGQSSTRRFQIPDQ